MFKSLKNFFYRMFSSDDQVSSKRVVGFLCFLLIAEIVQAVIWFDKPTPSELVYVISTVLLTCFGMNTAVNLKAIGAKTAIANTIIKEEPKPETTEDAKEILKADKP